MVTISETQNTYYTSEGLEALKTKLKTSVRFFNEQKDYPFKHKMLGFADWKVESKEELYYRIKELQQLTGMQIKEVKEEIVTSEGTKTKVVLKI